MKKILTIALGTLLFTQAGFAVQQIMQKELPLTKMQQQNRTIVKMASEELSKDLPQKIDQYTTLMKIEGKQESLIYIFEINTGAKSDEAVQKEDRTRMQKAVTRGVCHTSKRFLDADITIVYRYLSAKSKKELFHFDISKGNCTYIK
ncbi:hypothetical protein [Sulfurovum sp.]|uniref:hypothetical protein n=1 Tax=Sulfurovum sp. TaxID=1969726 RepID=UPI0025D0A608|nr:hypothetical protein [Sulfurovum sp.]